MEEYSRGGEGAGNGSSDLFPAVPVAPTGVYLEEAQLPFLSGDRVGRRLVCQPEACSLDLFPLFLPPGPTTSFEASATDRSGLGSF